MKITTNTFLLFAAVFIFEKGFGQDNSHIRSELFDEEDGLLSMWITSLAQDHNGHVWIGSLDGINRFDGNNFVPFIHKDNEPSSLLFDDVRFMKTDQKGILWVGYNEGGFSKYLENSQRFEHYTYYIENNIRKKLTGNNILGFEGDSIVWYGGKAAGLNRLNIKSKKHEHYDLPFIDTNCDKIMRPLYNTVNEMYVENEKVAWLATINGLYSFDLTNRSFQYIKMTTTVSRVVRNDLFVKLAPDAKKGLWLFANDGGISYYDKLSGKFSSYRYNNKNKEEKFSNEIDAITEKNAQEYWISTPDSGMGVFNTQTRSYYFPDYTAKGTGEYNTRKSRAMLRTRDSVLFVANNYGLLKFTPDQKLFDFKSLPITREQNSDHYFISCILDDTGSKSIYFGTMFANGLNVLDTRTNKFSSVRIDVNPNGSNNYQMVRSVQLDKEKRIWILSPYFLYQLDKKKHTLIKVISSDHIPNRKSNEYFSHLHIDNEGKFWFQTNHQGLYSYNSSQNTIGEAINTKPGAPKEINFICFDRKNRLWLASDSACVFYNEADGAIHTTRNKKLDSIVKNGIFRIATDPEGNVWMGINQFGLVKISYSSDNEIRFTEIGQNEGLLTNKLYNFGIDKSGNIWLASKAGVQYIKTDPISISLLNSSVGMQKNTLDMAFLNAGSGAFYITASGKYCKVNNFAKGPILPAPKVYIDNIKVLNVSKNFEVNSPTPVVLRPADNFFSIEFGCINFLNQSFNQFAYKLEGWDAEWIYCGKRRFANYTNLNGGNYTFKVKVANSVGQWGEPITLAILIEIPYYKKAWFILLLVGCLSGIVFAIYRARIGQIRNTEKLKTEFNKKLNETKLQALRAQMNPHFIFNSLNSINRYIIKSDVKVASYYITKFSKLMRLILDNSEHRKVVLSNELEALKLYIEMEALRFDNKFSFELLVDDTVSTDRIEVPPLLIQPYVENAIWHGLLHKEGEGKLTITVKTHGDMLICEVIDNGIGREKAMEYKSKNAPTRKSIGMKLTEERLRMKEMDEEENGSQEVIDLKNEAGEPIGTKVIIKIPI